MALTTETESRHLARRDDGKQYAIVTVVAHPDPAMIGVRQALPSGTVVVGRTQGALLPGVFDHRKVSREHARFTGGKQVRVEDLGSRNGTDVNGSPAVSAQPLESGDVVRIGSVALLFHRGPRAYAEPQHPEIVGSSHAVARLLEAIDEAAEAGTSVMILGETGTGKELVARAIHRASGRTGELVAVNCGGMADGVMQSELFGHARGAFSGAVSARPGLVAEAEGGTLYLDEVGAAPPALQTTLLRLLESGEYRMVGGNDLRKADVTFVAATQPDVADQIEGGGFRRDLWYRLAHRVVRVPSLRERPEDVMVLAHHFARERGRPVRFTPELATALVRHPWPGNVRELQSVVGRLIAGATGDELDVPAWLENAALTPSAAPQSRSQAPPTPRPSKEDLAAMFVRHKGKVAPIARELGVDRKTIYRWVEALQLDLDTLRH